MKKIFIALSVLAVLGFGFVPANAGGIGMPDDAPGCDLVAPFFLASMPGVDYANTLFVFTDVLGSALTIKAADGSVASTGFKFHYSVNTCRSKTVYNDNLTGTKYDIEATDAQTIVSLMSDKARKELEVDLDGDTVPDHWAGYIYFDREIADSVTGAKRFHQNSVVAQVLLVSLADGMASSANLPMKEFNPWFQSVVYPAQQLVTLWPDTGVTYRQEAFSPYALAAMEQAERGIFPFQAPTRFQLSPRYYIADELGATWLFLWRSTNWWNPVAMTGTKELHVLWYNDKEEAVSSNIPVPDELNIINVADYLPATLHSGFVKEGWIKITVPDYNGLPGLTAANGYDEWLGYTWIKAVGSASQSWTVLNAMTRWVDWPDKWDHN